MAGVIGLGAAVEYLIGLGRRFLSPELDDRGALVAAFGMIHARESKLATDATERLLRIPGLRVFGRAPDKAGIVKFYDGLRLTPHDIGTILDGQGIAIRAGHHCCMPLMGRLGVPATARASFAFYNNEVEVGRLEAGVRKIVEMFA